MVCSWLECLFFVLLKLLLPCLLSLISIPVIFGTIQTILLPCQDIFGFFFLGVVLFQDASSWPFLVDLASSLNHKLLVILGVYDILSFRCEGKRAFIRLLLCFFTHLFLLKLIKSLLNDHPLCILLFIVFLFRPCSNHNINLLRIVWLRIFVALLGVFYLIFVH